MAKGFKHGACGNPLNFKVVGGTSQPNDPKENMIWVNTETKITGWYFASEQPENMAEGEVLFLTTGKPSGAEFNTLKKNNITVYPYGAKQMVSGTLNDVTAKTYQDGKWVDWWNGEIYEYGNEYEAVTGGFQHNGKGSLNKDATSITMTMAGQGKNLLATKNAIDFTNFNTIHINILSLSAAPPNRTVGIFIETKPFGDGESVAAAEFTSTGENSIDVSNITGCYYIMLRVYSYSGTSSMKFDRVWLK